MADLSFEWYPAGIEEYGHAQATEALQVADEIIGYVKKQMEKEKKNI